MAAVLSESVLDQNGPTWSKRPFWSKWPYSELDFSIRETKMDQMLVHFGLKRSILVHCSLRFTREYLRSMPLEPPCLAKAMLGLSQTYQCASLPYQGDDKAGCYGALFSSNVSAIFITDLIRAQGCQLINANATDDTGSLSCHSRHQTGQELKHSQRQRHSKFILREWCSARD